LAPSLFFFTHPAPTPTYTLSLHDALPIFASRADALATAYRAAASTLDGLVAAATATDQALRDALWGAAAFGVDGSVPALAPLGRSEEHTSELQSRFDLVCRLLLEKKKHID